MRRFDAGTQRSLEQLAHARVLPRYEVVVDRKEAPEILERLSAAQASARDGDSDRSRRASGSLFHDGMERFAAHYDRSLGTLLDYLPDDTLVVLDDPGKLRERAEELEELIDRGHAESKAHYPAISAPAELYLPREQFDELARTHAGADWMGAIASVGDASRYERTLLVDAGRVCAPRRRRRAFAPSAVRAPAQHDGRRHPDARHVQPRVPG